MRRRSLLALLGSSLAAGCSTLDGPPALPSTTPAPVPTDAPSATRPTETVTDGEPFEPVQRWSLVELETQPVTVSLINTRGRTRDGGAVALAFIQPATADHPALLRGTFRNANSYENTFELRGFPLFRSVPSAWPGGRPRDQQYTYRDELLLAPTGCHELATKVPEWALADDGRWRVTGAINGPWFPDRQRLAPDEVVSLEYALVGHPEGQGFPRGRYHFEGSGRREVIFEVWSTDQPGPTRQSGFDGAGTSPLPDVDQMAWYHDASEETPVYLSPSEEQVALPAKVEFTLVNHSHATVGGNPHFWRLWKRMDGRWFHVAPHLWTLPAADVPPGGRVQWSLAAYNSHTASCEGARPVGYLGGGRYAFEVGIGREAVTHAALLDFDAPAASLEPTDGLAVSRDGSNVHVEWPRREDEVPRATLTLTRTDSADNRLIAEQVMQRPYAALRNTLAFMTEETDQVELVTDQNTISTGLRTLNSDDETSRFRYGGVNYEVRAEFGEDQ